MSQLLYLGYIKPFKERKDNYAEALREISVLAVGITLLGFS